MVQKRCGGGDGVTEGRRTANLDLPVDAAHVPQGARIEPYPNVASSENGWGPWQLCTVSDSFERAGSSGCAIR